MSFAIRPLQETDYTSWQPLWLANNKGQINEEVTEETWRRLIAPDSGVHGMGAWRNEEMAGLVHYILHPVTGHIQPACYMQDLFIAPSARRQGVGRALVEALTAQGRENKWARLYWLAAEDNKEAQAFYRSLGLKLPFSFHVMPL